MNLPIPTLVMLMMKGSENAKSKATRAPKILAWNNAKNFGQIVRLGAIRPLVQLLREALEGIIA